MRMLVLGMALVWLWVMGCGTGGNTTGASSSSGSSGASGASSSGGVSTSTSAGTSGSSLGPSGPSSGAATVSSTAGGASSLTGPGSSASQGMVPASSGPGASSLAMGSSGPTASSLTPPSSSTTGTPVTVTFQQGANGYDGARSVDISSGNLGPPGQYGENGTTYGDGNSDWCIGVLAATGFGYDISPLLRFENLGIPAGAVVQSAQLTLNFVEWDRPATLTGRYLKVPWDANVNDPNGGVTTSAVGWRYRAAGQAWAALGATGDGTDVWAGKMFAFPPLSANGAQVATADLDPEMVQRWVDNPAENHGVILQVQETGVHLYFSQNQRPTVAARPLLRITYR